jgi:serine/threonine-protein kinase
MKAAEASSQLAVVYANNAFPNADAEAAARRALALRTAHAPDDRKALADSWNTLGLVFEGGDRYDEAEAALRKGLDLRRSLGADGAGNQVSASLHNLGLVAAKRGDYMHALDYYRQSLGLKRVQYGEHHPDYQITLQGYARALSDSGKPEQAIPLFEQNLALCRELYGEHSSKLGEAHNVLAYSLHDLGRFAQAIEHYREAMRIHAEVSGEESAASAVPLNNLAYAHEDIGDLASAIPLYERSLAIRRKTLPDDDGLVLRARYNLARALTKAGRLDPAKSQLDIALAGMRAHFGEDDANSAKCELLLADWQLRSHQVDAAARTFAALQKSRARFTPLMQARRETVASMLAAARGDRAGAIEHRRSAFETMRTKFGAQHPLVAEFALAYAASLSDGGRNADARAVVAPLRAMIESTFVPDAPIRAELARWR